VFVASALVLYAGSLLHALSALALRACGWLSLALLLIYLRKFIPNLQTWGVPDALLSLLPLCVDAVALAAALALLALSRSAWPRLQPQ
jgi:hypothetical protein